jgi:hypothetical protein
VWTVGSVRMDLWKVELLGTASFLSFSAFFIRFLGVFYGLAPACWRVGRGVGLWGHVHGGAPGVEVVRETLFGGVKQVLFGGGGGVGYKNLVSLKLIVYSGGSGMGS